MQAKAHLSSVPQANNSLPLPGEEMPLVSVIIPCYNQGIYLPEAIRSVTSQTYPRIEIIVVNDGSTDNTESVALAHPGVRYVYQSNKGLSAARNTGIRHSAGQYLLFLDADDFLYPGAIACNVAHLQQNENVVFVSGAHDVISEDKRRIGEKVIPVVSNHYLELLKGNYIGMHATVLYRRSVFHEFSFDETLKSCEDYDLYLRVARKYPVLHHTEKLTAYRMHGANMSRQASRMLHQILSVLQRQEPHLKNKREAVAYQAGVRFYKFYYSKLLFHQLKNGAATGLEREVATLYRYNKFLYIRYLLQRKLPDFGFHFFNRWFRNGTKH